MARKTTFLAGLIFLLSSLLFAQGELYGPVYIIGDDGRLYIDNIPDTITASYLAVIDDGWLKKLDIDNLDLDTSNIAGLYDYLNAKSDTGHIHDTGDVTNLSLYLGQKLDATDTSYLARKVHIHDTSDVTGLHNMLAGKEPSLGSGDNMSTLRGSDKTWTPVTSMLSLTPPSSPDQYYKYNGSQFVWSDIPIADVTDLQDALDLKLDISDTSVFVRDPELNNYYTKTNLKTSGQSSVHWNNITNEPAFITGVSWDEISGDQSDVDVSGFNNDAGYLTSLPSHDHDTRYLKLTGGTLTGDVSFNASTEYANVTDLGFVAPIKIPDFITTVDNMFVPFLHTTTRVQTGYRKHVSIGSYRTGLKWHGGIYFAQGGNDNYPTEHFLMEYGGNLKFINSSGTAYKFYNENFKPTWGDIGSKPSVFPPDAHGHTLSEVLAAGNNGSDGLPLLQIFNDTVAYLGSNSRHKLVLASIDNPQWRSYTGHYDLWNESNFNPDTVANVSHNHSAFDITSGTLSNDRLNFNPDYLVQGTDSYRRANYTSTNTLDDNNASGFFRLDPTDPANPDGTVAYYGLRTRHSATHSVELVGRAEKNKLWFGGLYNGIRQPWREIWHEGNLDTANIVNTVSEQYINGTKHFSSKVYAQGGVYTSYNVGTNDRYWRFRDGLFLYYNGSQIMGCNPVTGNKLKWEVPFDIRDKVEISDTLMLGNKAVSGDNIVAQYIKNNSVSDSTSASINFGLAQSAGYHHAAIKGMRTNKGAGHASSIYLQARPAVSGIGTGHLEDVVEAGFDDQQAFVKYHNNPPIIHSEFENIGSNSQTLNPTKGVYICGGRVNAQEITLGTTGVENGQTVKILKASNLLAGVRYGASGNYQWRSIGHYGAAEFIHYNGVWFCHGTEYIP